MRTRPRTVIAVATAMRIAASKSGEHRPASEAMHRAWALHRAVQDASWYPRHASKYCFNETGLRERVQQGHLVPFFVTERQQRIFDLLMSGLTVAQVRALEAAETANAREQRPMQSKGRRRSDSGSEAMQDKGLQVSDSGSGAMQNKLSPPEGCRGNASPEAAAATAVAFQDALETRTAVGGDRPLQRKPKAKVKRRDAFPVPTAGIDYEVAVLSWSIGQCLREMRAAQRRDEPEPTAANMALLRVDDIEASAVIERPDSNNPAARSPRRGEVRLFVREKQIEFLARKAAVFASEAFDPRRALLEEEAGRRGGEKSRRGKAVTIEMVQQPGIPEMSIAKAAKALGCSPRTIASRRAEIRAAEAAAAIGAPDGRDVPQEVADGRAAAPDERYGPARAIFGDLDLSWLNEMNPECQRGSRSAA